MQRIIIIALAILISLPFIIKSRVSGTKPSSTAFSVVSSGACLIRVSGDVRHPGLYSVPANTLAGTAIKMAVPAGWFKRLTTANGNAYSLAQGDHVQLAIDNDGIGAISIGCISSNERMIMGVPLDINAMTAADFALLPGIGPVVAQRIVEYRQKNGGKMSVGALRQVEGIGDKKYKAMVIYF